MKSQDYDILFYSIMPKNPKKTKSENKIRTEIGVILVKIKDGLKWQQKDIVAKLGFSAEERSKYYSYEGAVNAPVTFFEKYKTSIGIDLLLSKEKGRLIVTDPTKFTPEERDILFKKLNAVYNGIPIYDMKVTAGTTSLIHDEAHDMPSQIIQVSKFEGSAFGLKVDGDSMYPEIKSGDFVFFSKQLSPKDIKTQGFYLVITSEMAAVKKVFIDKRSKEHVLLRSINPGFAEVRLEAAQIVRLHKVMGFLREEKNFDFTA
ncbi:S24 family peptidase [Chitinophaga vietnamensis]|uniref:S24 family peptidase n=1 Tax=Chitinophaga vietnamensis TaxID=2593957 RepID=UPI001177630D|nr:S24 family peptidase [Chitinophaga vietnamensis]